MSERQANQERCGELEWSKLYNRQTLAASINKIYGLPEDSASLQIVNVGEMLPRKHRLRQIREQKRRTSVEEARAPRKLLVFEVFVPGCSESIDEETHYGNQDGLVSSGLARN